VTEADIHHNVMLIRNAVMKVDKDSGAPHLEIFALIAQFLVDFHAIAEAHRKVMTS
jgi:hypothetical protein